MNCHRYVDAHICLALHFGQVQSKVALRTLASPATIKYCTHVIFLIYMWLYITSYFPNLHNVFLQMHTICLQKLCPLPEWPVLDKKCVDGQLNLYHRSQSAKALFVRLSNFFSMRKG